MTRAVRGRTIPYGTLVGASAELKQAYYSHGYLHDEDMPKLPCVPLEGECVDPGEELCKKDVVRLIEAVLEEVSLREKKVVCLRFGIGLTQEYTLDEIGVMFNLSGNRIRQIEGTALRYMKHPLRSDKLRELEKNK
jgi:DNA-directed RNA polymerase sigma subunit (sigma70/sigma32)